MASMSGGDSESLLTRTSQQAATLSDDELSALISFSMTASSSGKSLTFQGPISQFKENIDRGSKTLKRLIEENKHGLCAAKEKVEQLDTENKLRSISDVVAPSVAGISQNPTVTSILVAVAVLRIGLDYICAS